MSDFELVTGPTFIIEYRGYTHQLWLNADQRAAARRCFRSIIVTGTNATSAKSWTLNASLAAHWHWKERAA